MRIAHLIVPATLLALLLATRAVFAQTNAPTPIVSPTSVVAPAELIPTSLPSLAPSPTVVSISSSPPIAEPETSSTLPVGEAPLSLAQRISSESVMPGSQVRYTIQIASSRVGATIETQSLLPPQLRLIDASISGGSCNGTGSVICQTTLGQSGSATIEIVAQVLPGVAVGTKLVSQTLAQDDLNYTAASDQTAVTVIAAPATQNSSTAAAQPGQPAQPAKLAPTVQPAQPVRDPQPAPGANRSIGTPRDIPIDAIPANPVAIPVDRRVPIQDTSTQNAIPEVSGQDEQRIVRHGR